ncbi:hypothetical protein [Clostridium sp.]|uniref:hypothetical protein n=1 Tax=Clostridium sp. TaxID=1506 RepID=UPI0025BADBE0|nr:hypothetical protein [Clostridium sp.]
MKNIMRLMFVLSLSLLIIGAVPIRSNSHSDNFDFMETEFIKNSNFIQNGIKVEYSINQPIDKELSLLKDNFKKSFGEDVQSNENIIVYKDSIKEIKAVVWSNNENIKVQITYINNDKDANTFQLKKELKQIQNIAAKNIKYFNFIKVKIIEDQKQNLLDILKKNIDMETLEVLNIHNGSVGKAKLYDGNKINIGFTKYDTGEYLIIGTPVIFVTY